MYRIDKILFSQLVHKRSQNKYIVLNVCIELAVLFALEYIVAYPVERSSEGVSNVTKQRSCYVSLT